MTMSDADTGGLSLSVAKGVATILFDRWAARNAMLLSTWGALADAVAAADGDPAVGVIVLRGAGGHFGSGNDIAEFAAHRGDRAGAEAYGWAMARAMAGIEQAAKPVIAAIEGSCFGASVAVALAADLRLASRDAVLAITPAKLGALYLRSDHHRLVAAVGQGQARRMIYTACALTAEQAAAIGLVEQCASAGRFEDELGVLTAAILAGSVHTLRHSKRLLCAVGAGIAPAETAESIGLFADAMQGPDFAEGVAAFLSKRAPRFPAMADFR